MIRLIRHSLRATFLALFFGVFIVSAASANIKVRVRDGLTHQGIQATVKLEGPESLSLLTDKTGRLSRALAPGEYREEYSAPGYRTLRSHHLVEAGKTTALGAFLTPETPPEEESPETLKSKARRGYTLLHEYVVDGETGEPLAGVRVRVLNAGVETQTDSKGHYWLSVPTPQPAAQPAFPGGMGTDTLVYEKGGYKTLVLRNFGIAGEDMGGIAVELRKGSGVIHLDATHKLMRNDPEPAGAQARWFGPYGRLPHYHYR